MQNKGCETQFKRFDVFYNILHVQVSKKWTWGYNCNLQENSHFVITVNKKKANSSLGSCTYKN